MQFEIVKIIDTIESHPDEVGEYFRDRFFGDRTEKGLGCYKNFEFVENVEEHLLTEENLPLHWQDEGLAEKVVCGVEKETGIKCFYFWDHDGALEFHFPDGSKVENYDCKHTHSWWRTFDEN